MSYLLLKMIHVSSVVISYSLFFLRGIWLVQDSSYLQKRWVKVLPHVIDTVLLTSAITLAILIQQDPVNHAWLTAKVVGLLLYIFLGMIAIRFGRTKKVRVGAWIAAQCVFIYIVLVALNKNPWLNLI